MERFELRSDGRLPYVTFPSRGKSWLPWQPPGVHLRLSKFPSPRVWTRVTANDKTMEIRRESWTKAIRS